MERGGMNIYVRRLMDNWKQATWVRKKENKLKRL